MKTLEVANITRNYAVDRKATEDDVNFSNKMTFFFPFKLLTEIHPGDSGYSHATFSYSNASLLLGLHVQKGTF